MFDRDELADLIEGGRLRQASSEEIADELFARMEDPEWARVMSHPTRTVILRLLRDHGPLSPVKATRLVDDVSLGTMSYHFRTLHRLGYIELASTQPRRGSVEHTYALVPQEGAAS